MASNLFNLLLKSAPPQAPKPAAKPSPRAPSQPASNPRATPPPGSPPPVIGRIDPPPGMPLQPAPGPVSNGRSTQPPRQIVMPDGSIVYQDASMPAPPPGSPPGSHYFWNDFTQRMELWTPGSTHAGDILFGPPPPVPPGLPNLPLAPNDPASPAPPVAAPSAEPPALETPPTVDPLAPVAMPPGVSDFGQWLTSIIGSRGIGGGWTGGSASPLLGPAFYQTQRSSTMPRSMPPGYSGAGPSFPSFSGPRAPSFQPPAPSGGLMPANPTRLV